MKRYRLAEKAVADLERISRSIAAANPKAAANWLDGIFNACEKASLYPEIGPQRDELAAGLRSIPVGNYMVFYRHETGNLVLIVRIFHGAQDIPRLLAAD